MILAKNSAALADPAGRRRRMQDTGEEPATN
jgi:hypothetical protein